MHYFQIIADFADLFFPWVMLINGFVLGLLVAGYFDTKPDGSNGDDEKGNDGESK